MVIYETYRFYEKHSLWFVAMTTEMPKKGKILKENHLLRSNTRFLNVPRLFEV